MEIKATSKYDKKALTALVRVGMFKRLKPLAGLLILLGILIAFTAFVIVVGVTYNTFKTFGVYVFMLVFVSFFLCYMYFLFPGLQYKRMGNFSEVENVFVFTDDQVTISQNKEGYDGTAVLRYDMIYKVYETSDYFFLYQNKNAAYIVDKSTISNSEAEQIREKISAAVGKTYRVCKY